MTHPGELHQISAEIGGLKKSVDMLTQMWSRNDEQATMGRRSLHEKFEALKTDVGIQIAGLSLRMDRLTDKVTMLEPSVTTFKDRIRSDDNDKLIEEGARKFRMKLGAVIMAGAGTVGFLVHELLSYIKPH